MKQRLYVSRLDLCEAALAGVARLPFIILTDSAPIFPISLFIEENDVEEDWDMEMEMDDFGPTRTSTARAPTPSAYDDLRAAGHLVPTALLSTAPLLEPPLLVANSFLPRGAPMAEAPAMEEFEAPAVEEYEEQELTAYEVRRLANIAANDKELASLNISPLREI